jgi:hypothetical protein
MTKPKDKSLIGAAGEHLVLSRLLAAGFLAAQAPRGTRKIDILVNFIDGGQPFLIQVKSRSKGGSKGWHMSAKHELIRDEDLFYCLVDFEPANPEVYVIPAVVVAEALEMDHAIWFATPGKNGQAHNETAFRRLRPDSNGVDADWMDQYLENWGQLVPQH